MCAQIPLPPSKLRAMLAAYQTGGGEGRVACVDWRVTLSNATPDPPRPHIHIRMLFLGATDGQTSALTEPVSLFRFGACFWVGAALDGQRVMYSLANVPKPPVEQLGKLVALAGGKGGSIRAMSRQVKLPWCWCARAVLGRQCAKGVERRRARAGRR